MVKAARQTFHEWRLFLIAASTVAGVTLLALVAQSAKAEVLDLSTIACKQFFGGMKSEETAIILSWLHGYFREEKDPLSRTFCSKCLALVIQCR